MATPNPKHQDFVSRLRQCAQQLKDALDAAQSLQADYMLLGYNSATGADPLTAEDFANSANGDLQPADVDAFVSNLAPVQSLLIANNNQLATSLRKLGR